MLLSIFYGSISIIAVIGNSLVIWIVATTRQMQTVTNLFIANLALADVVIGMFVIPFQVIICICVCVFSIEYLNFIFYPIFSTLSILFVHYYVSWREKKRCLLDFILPIHSVVIGVWKCLMRQILHSFDFSNLFILNKLYSFGWKKKIDMIYWAENGWLWSENVALHSVCFFVTYLLC